MGTRSFVGVYDDEGSWSARYCHWDGYPSGVGATLWENYKRHFQDNLGAMVEILMSEPVGWSSLAGCDLSLPPVWIEGYKGSNTDTRRILCTEVVRQRLDAIRLERGLTEQELLELLDENAPKSYLARGETEECLIVPGTDFSHLEWGYLFNAKDYTLTILKAFSGGSLFEEILIVNLKQMESLDWRGLES